MDNANIKDRENFEKYQKKRAEWEKLLVGDEHHAIQDQIHSMIRDDLSFRIFNEAQKIGSKNSSSCSQNGFLARSMLRGYVLGQGISLRKLTEKNPRDKNKGVISLRRILDDICDSQSLLTREVYVSFDGIPYDWNEAEEGMYNDNPIESVSWRGIPRTYSISQIRHQQFDLLSGVKSESRCRWNRIQSSVFDGMKRRLKESNVEDIIGRANKYLVHAADDVSRSTENFKNFSVTMNQISTVHCAIIEVFYAICDCILLVSCDSNVIPVLQYNPFENLDKPFVKLGMMSELSQLLDDYTKERDVWCSDVMEKLVPKMAEKECQVDEKGESSGA